MGLMEQFQARMQLKGSVSLVANRIGVSSISLLLFRMGSESALTQEEKDRLQLYLDSGSASGGFVQDDKGQWVWKSIL